MFAKIFGQIFDSSIADDYQTRHVFMDLLVLADSDGVVDMTAGAIARRTNVPQEIVEVAIKALCSPDPDSRTKTDHGCRMLPLDEQRGWGWQIVNYHHYRRIRDEESRRAYYREYRREEREKKRPEGKKKPSTAIVPRHVIAPKEEDHSRSFDQWNAHGRGASGEKDPETGRSPECPGPPQPDEADSF